MSDNKAPPLLHFGDNDSLLQAGRRNSVEILILFSACIMLAVALVGYLAYHDAERLITNSISRQFSSALSEIDFDVSQRQEKLLQVARNVAKLGVVGDALQEGASSPDWPLAEAYTRELLTRARIAADEVGNILVFDCKGNTVMDLEGQRVRTVPWSEDQNLPPIPSFGANMRTMAGVPQLFAAVPIMVNDKMVGSCVVTMNMDVLRTYLTRRFVSSTDLELRLALLSDTGIILLSTSPHLPPGDMYDTDPLRQAVAAEQGELVLLDNGTRLGMSLRLPRMKVIAIISEDRAKLLAPASQLRSNTLLYSGGVAFLGVLLVAVYVSTLTRRTEKLQTRYLATVEMAGLPTWDWSAHDNSMRVNSHFWTLLGYEPRAEALAGDTVHDLIPPEDFQRLEREALTLSFGRKNRIAADVRMRHQDGHWHWVESVGNVVEWTSSGRPSRICGIIMDIHEKKIREAFATEYRTRLESEVEQRTNTIREREASLRQERAVLQSVLNSMPDIIYFRDMEKNLIGGNRAFYEFFNTTPEEAKGKPPFDPLFISSLSVTALRELAEQDDYVLSTGNLLEMEEALELAGGSFIYFETNKSLMVDENGDPIGLLGLSRDITHRKSVEDALERARGEALAASRAKSEFLANMSHEIRTPLNGILGLNHLALQLNPPDELRRYLARVEISARNLLSIVNDLLDFSKIEAGRIQLEYVPFSLEDAITSALDMMRPQAEVNSVELRLSMTPLVPRAILGDSLRFGQVLLNLLSNAVKFTSKGRVELSLWTGPAALPPEDDGPNNWLRLYISVEDTGIGMTEEQLARLFSPFTQADTSTTRKYGGTGLGLVISRSLIECMGGQLSVESVPDQGTRFVLEMDVAEAETTAPIETTLSMSEIPLKGKRILLAEDNEINQIVAVEMLRNLGCTVDVANDGLEAVDMAHKSNYDAVLMDIQMPNMDGYAATRTLRDQNLTIPIIAMTANAMAEDRKKTREAGMQAHVVKPIDPIVLREVMITWICGSSG